MSLSLLPNNPEREPLFERFIAPAQDRIINLGAAIRNIEAYVNSAEVGAPAASVSQESANAFQPANPGYSMSETQATIHPIRPETRRLEDDLEALNQAAKAEARSAGEVINVPKIA